MRFTKWSNDNPNIHVNVAFEQASFVEELISGVAREGGLGAIFAVLVILIFLSSGTWGSHPRRIAGAVMVALFLVLIGAVHALELRRNRRRSRRGVRSN